MILFKDKNSFPPLDRIVANHQPPYDEIPFKSVDMAFVGSKKEGVGWKIRFKYSDFVKDQFVRTFYVLYNELLIHNRKPKRRVIIATPQPFNKNS